MLAKAERGVVSDEHAIRVETKEDGRRKNGAEIANCYIPFTTLHYKHHEHKVFVVLSTTGYGS